MTSPDQQASMAGRVTTKTAGDLNAPARAGLSAASRWLTRVLALAYLLIGLVMFAFRRGPRITWRGKCRRSSR